MKKTNRKKSSGRGVAEKTEGNFLMAIKGLNAAAAKTGESKTTKTKELLVYSQNE